MCNESTGGLFQPAKEIINRLQKVGACHSSDED